jgi:hypothetical protein
MSDRKTRFLTILLLSNIVAICALLAILSPWKRSAPSPETGFQAGNNFAQSGSNQKTSPADSAAWAPGEGDLSMNVGSQPEGSFFGEIRDWARKDPEAALAWADRQPANDDARTEARTDACFEIAQTDPKRAVLLAEQYRLSKTAVLQNLAQQWSQQDLAAARNWITAQPDGDNRNAMAAGVAYIWSQTQPAAAAQYVMLQMQPGSAQDNAVMAVVHQWAVQDLAGASSWVQQFSAGPLRDQAMKELAGVAQYEQGGAR